MSACMPTGKPLIAILMAVYNPRMDWLKLQLASLNSQTYPNLRLYIRDDCSSSIPFEEIQALVSQCITAFSFTIVRNEKNLGSNLTFEQLTREAEGEYFAYCDQDDIWDSNKLEMLFENINRTNATLSYCGQAVIDEESNVIAGDIRTIRSGDIFLEGKDCFRQLVVKNCIYGCTTIVPKFIAKESLPLPESFNYDHWISLWAAHRGTITRIESPLVFYRLHDRNQSTPLRGINTKQDYTKKRIYSLRNRLLACKSRFSDDEDTREYISELLQWVADREKWLNGYILVFPKILQSMHHSPKAVCFELIIPFCSERFFYKLINILKKRENPFYKKD